MRKMLVKAAKTVINVSVIYGVVMVVFMTLGFTVVQSVFDFRNDEMGTDDSSRKEAQCGTDQVL
ncbi:hypothetical protein [Lacrimispora saccharolytica]|uniref:Uncharacterized protein n=1 Tax=Lacrimispora saccharolytica (strain ATCC 35040 / DSM 2544 / NRCC 2533 / WM1) TaxID=610130 RepID=D9R393_LACSW|nr:hypothetical protein [Lacrimispora saccharolytica]ADL04842.1 hypothetical protein Closa_2264 [[Clostridium] saccharolyticum WM1]QRV20948.1 hypothetical protein I6K70_05460 [Lacrimispora saccharolytica]